MALYLYVLPLGGAGCRWRSWSCWPADLRADPPPLSVAARALEPREHDRSACSGLRFVWVIWKLPSGSRVAPERVDLATGAGLAVYPLFYLGVSWAISVIHWRKQLSHRQSCVR